MANQSAATQSKDSSATVPVNSSNEQIRERIRERIALRAYDLFQQEGNQEGHDMRHWLQAESEIVTDVPEIRESASWFTVNVPLRGFTANEVQVTVEPQIALIAAEKQQVSASEPRRPSGVFEHGIFTTAKWPVEVDPNTASAYLKNGVLTLTVKRATPSV
jgi:HSP20 family molecular chaperone IbpA